MNIKDNKLKSNLIVATYTVILAFLVFNIDKVGGVLGGIITVIKPFLIGVAIAFVLNIPMKLLEKKVFCKILKKKKKIDLTVLIRPLSLITSIILIIGVLIGIIVFVVPQLIESGSALIDSIPEYANRFEKFLSQYTANTEILENIYNQILNAGKEILTVIGTITTSLFGGVLQVTVGITSSIISFVIAFIAAIYILLSKEKLILQMKKLLYAFIKAEKADKILYVGRIVNDKFSKFVSGQVIEACILGLLCFMGMSIFRIPYALLVSTLIAITALIPIVGAFLGLIPSTFIILMVDPMTAVWFVILILIIQQIEGNIIYPFVVGNSIGISALWVLFAITVGGNTFGILGMLIGVPLFGVIYTILSIITNKKLREKNIDVK